MNLLDLRIKNELKSTGFQHTQMVLPENVKHGRNWTVLLTFLKQKKSDWLSFQTNKRYLIVFLSRDLWYNLVVKKDRTRLFYVLINKGNSYLSLKKLKWNLTCVLFKINQKITKKRMASMPNPLKTVKIINCFYLNIKNC